MATRGGYDSGPGAGGKIRRRPPSRAAAASPYARPPPAPAPAPTPAAPPGGGEGGGWFTRLIAGSASLLFSSVFGKPAALQPQPDPFDAPPSQPEPLDAPPSPPPPPLEDISEGEENGGAIANNTDNLDNPSKEGDDMQRTSDGHGATYLEELLKKRTFTRSEFEYLAELLRSRTIGSNSLKPAVGSLNQTHFSEKELGSRDLPVDFSIKTYNVADQVASPAELAKAYMGSKSSRGSPLRLRLHDPSSRPFESIEASTVKRAKPFTPSLLPSSRLHGSTPTDHTESNHMTPNRSAIYKMSSSPYFKSVVSSRDLSGNVSSSYQTAGSVHTFGRQVLKRKSTSLNNESDSVGPIRKMRQKYNRVSPLLQTRPGCHGYLGSRASKLDEDFENSTQTQKRRCLDKASVSTQSDVDNTAHGNNFGQAPAQSAEMAAKILKQLDMLVPSQKGSTSETRQKHENAMDVEDPISEKKELLAQNSVLQPSSSEANKCSLPISMNGTANFMPAAIDGKTVGAASEKSSVLKRKSASEIASSKDSVEVDNCSGDMKIALLQANDKIEKKNSPTPEHSSNSSVTTNMEKPPSFPLRSHAPSNLVLSSEIDRSKMLASSIGFSFPVPAALGVQSQAPPTPTLASPPLLPIEKQQSSAVSSAPVTLAESVARIFKPVSEEGTIANKCDEKLNADNQPVSKSSGQVVSFTSNHVFSVVKSKPAILSNGLAHTSRSTPSSVASTPQLSFQSGFQTSSTSAQQCGNAQSKAESNLTALFSSQSSSSGGSLSFSATGGTGGSSTSPEIFAATTAQSVIASSGSGSCGAPFSFSSQFGSASSLTAQDKSKAGNVSAPFTLSPQFGTASLVSGHEKSKVASTESMLMSGNHCAQSGNSTLLFTQSTASNLNVISSEKSNAGSSSIFANSLAPSTGSPFNSSPVTSFGLGSGSTSVATTCMPSFPALTPVSGSSSSFLASTTTAPPIFGSLNTAASSSQFSSTSSPIFSFTSATPTVPHPSSTAPIFGRISTTFGSHAGADQMNGCMIGDKNQPPFSAASLFGLPSTSPSTPVVSTPSTQLASTPSESPGIFQFGQQSQASSGGFSMGTGGGNDKSGRRIIRVKRKK